MVRAPGCGPGDRGFEPHHPPHFSPATRCERALGRGQAVRHETLTLALAGSTPAAPAMFDPLAQLAEHLTFNQGVRSSNLRWVTSLAFCSWPSLPYNPFLLQQEGAYSCLSSHADIASLISAATLVSLFAANSFRWSLVALSMRIV